MPLPVFPVSCLQRRRGEDYRGGSRSGLLLPITHVRVVPAHVIDHDFIGSDRAARTENLNGERGVGIRPHPKCGILRNPTSRRTFVACVAVAGRQSPPPRRTVRIVLAPGGELLPQKLNGLVVQRAVVPGLFKRAVTSLLPAGAALGVLGGGCACVHAVAASTARTAAGVFIVLRLRCSAVTETNHERKTLGEVSVICEVAIQVSPAHRC